MKFALVDPPYLGTAAKHYGEHHEDAKVYDTIEGHKALIDRVFDDFPDGWALCLGSTSLRAILPLCPEDVRIGSWCKPFASFKPNVNPAYCWEPLIWRGGRKRRKTQPTIRDYCRVNITLQRGIVGAKPEEFCWWVFDLLGAEPEDELVDLFPGTMAVSRAWESYHRFNAGLLAVLA